MKVQKKILCLLLVALVSFAMAIMTMPISFVKAADTAPTTETFKVYDGASIRRDINAIKFRTEISAEEYGGLITAYGEGNVVFGMYVAKSTAALDEATLKASGLKIDEIVWDKNDNPTSKTASTYAYNLAIEGFDDANLNKYYTVMGYIEIANEDPIYTTPVSYTPMQVATAHINGENFDEEVDSFVLGIVDKVVAAKQTFEIDCEDTATVNEPLSIKTLIDGVEVTADYTVSNQAGTFENGAFTASKGGPVTITATVKGATGDYACEKQVNVAKGEARPEVNADGTLTFGTNGQTTTIKINDVAVNQTVVDGEFNVVDYILDTYTVNEQTTYTISVDSDAASGSITHDLIPVNNASFKNTIKTATIDNMDKRHYFLTEDVVFTTADYARGYGNMNWRTILTNVYANLDGRGHEISYTYDGANSGNTDKLVGLILNMYATWQNIYFDMNVESLSAGGCDGLFGYNWGSQMQNSDENAAVINCYFDIDVNENVGKNITVFAVVNGNVENNVFDITYATTNNKVYITDTGAKGSPTIDNNVIIYNVDNLTVASGEQPNKTTSGNVHYTSIDGFILGGNYNEVGKDAANFKNVVVEEPTYKYATWSDVWTINTTSKTIDLCDKRAYGAVNKTAMTVTFADNVLSIDNKGELYDIYASVGGGNVELVAADVFGTSYDLTAWVEGKGTALANKMVVYTVESRHYSGSVDHLYQLVDAQVAIDTDGIVTFNTGSEAATLSVNGTVIDGAVSGFNLSNYVIDTLKPTEKTTYTVAIASETYYGEAEKIYVPLTNSNFISAQTEYNTLADRNVYFFLTENISIDRYYSSTDKGVMTTANSYNNLSGGTSTYYSIFTNLYTTLNGNGYTIGYDQVAELGALGIGITYNFIGAWTNVVFDIDITNVKNNSGGMIACDISMEDGIRGSFKNCYFDLDITGSISGGARLFFKNNSGTVSNCIVDITSNIANVTFEGHPNDGVSTRSSFNNNAVISNVVVNDLTSKLYYDGIDLYYYTNFADFISGVNGKQYTATAETWNSAASSSDYTGKCYAEWDSVWSITEGSITLCGKTVYTATVAE